MSYGHHRYQVLDGVVGLLVERGRCCHVGDGLRLIQDLVDGGVWLAVLRVGFAEVEVQEVGDVGIVSTPAQQVEAIEATVGRLIDELTGLHHDDVGRNAEVLFQLGLELNCHKAGLGQIAAEHVPVVDGGLEPIWVPSVGQHLSRGLRIELIPLVALTGVSDRARREVRSNL